MEMSKNILLSVLLMVFANDIRAAEVDTISIRKHLEKIVQTEKHRNHTNIEALNQVANYIFHDFEKYADTVYYQSYLVNNQEYKNVVCVFGSENAKTIVVGAHYDVNGDQDGADDNASGVVGLLELAKQLSGDTLKYRIEMVAYTLEEPPFFRSENMGSFIHAKSLHENKRDVYGMVCLEMIGYFDNAKNSQKYPMRFLSLFYGNKGNYITLVNKISKGKFSRKFNSAYTGEKSIRTKKFNAPAIVPGVDLSDHLNYWSFGFSALMITDTAFYRNGNYHRAQDTIETLDLERMGHVIDAVYESLIKLK